MKDVRHQLFLLRELVKRDFQGRYAGSLLGFFWSFVQPLWLLLLFTFVFSTVLSGGRRDDRYRDQGRAVRPSRRGSSARRRR